MCICWPLAFRLISNFRVALSPNLWFGSTEITKSYSHKQTLTHTNTQKMTTTFPPASPRCLCTQIPVFEQYRVFISLLNITPLNHSPLPIPRIKKDMQKTHQQPTMTRLNLSSPHNKSVNKYLRVSTAVSPRKITDLNWSLSLSPDGQRCNYVNKRNVEADICCVFFVYSVVKIHETAVSKMQKC